MKTHQLICLILSYLIGFGLLIIANNPMGELTGMELVAYFFLGNAMWFTLVSLFNPSQDNKEAKS